ncbi:MAG: putative FlgJ-related protein [Arenicella sp.]|jgi:uncharacterized FlgJ-related protein
MKQTDFSFTIKGKSFIPNRNFWLILLVLFTIGAWTGYDLYKHYEANQLQLNELNEKWEGFGNELTEVEDLQSKNSNKVSQFAPKLIVAIISLLGIFLRKIIDWSLKLNNTLLLTQAKFRDFTKQPVMLRLGSSTFSYQPNNAFWYVIGGLVGVTFATVFYLHSNNQQMETRIAEMQGRTVNLETLFEAKNYKDDVMGYFIDYFTAYNDNQESIESDYRDAFLIQKQLLLSQFLIREKVARVDQLSNESLLQMNHKIARMFEELVLGKLTNIEPHVHTFFTDTTKIDKLETALMEQAKYHVPSSITLAQAALETAWGRRVIENNYFGIKDKTNSTKYTTTTEYYNEAEMKANRSKILSKKKVKKGGKTLYKCSVKDFFVAYESPWASFRGHSLFLSNSKRYSPLFTKGKDYRAWAKKIGSTKYGGVGYATSPVYGELLTKIVGRYHLDLLDY